MSLLTVLNWTCFLKRLHCGSVVQNLPLNARDAGSILGLERCPGEGNGNPLQYFCLGNPMDREAWQAKFMGFQKSWTWLKDQTTIESSKREIYFFDISYQGNLVIYSILQHRAN